MQINFKDKPTLILGILVVFFFVLNIGSCINAYSQNSARRKEMIQRMDLEEKMGKFSQEKAAMIDKLKAKDKELEDELSAHQATKKALTQEQMVSQSLKEELQKVTKIKDALEEELKQALTTGKKNKK
jgi:biopolymer transport protein ExbB/TolQ